jgi:NTP pyrophosphatase (non-canonical NTP hydrolase)
VDIERLRSDLRAFADERDWDQFHSPKNLSMALSVEAAELLEHFQWLSEEESRSLSPNLTARAAEELADIQIYLIRLADKLNVDIEAAVQEKLKRNALKYPAEKVRGKASKYTDYQDETES